MLGKRRPSSSPTIVALLCLASIGYSQESPAVSKPIPLVGMISLIIRPPVLQELGIEEGSDEALRIRALLKPFPGTLQQRLNHPSDDERKERLSSQELYARIEAEFVEKLRDVLSPEQFTRLQQIHWQRWGTLAILDPAFAKLLAVTENQAEQLHQKHVEYEQQKKALQQSRNQQRAEGTDVRGFKQKLDELEQELEASVLSILSPEQRRRIPELKGRPFALTESERPATRKTPQPLKVRTGGPTALLLKEPVCVELGIDQNFSLQDDLRKVFENHVAELTDRLRALPAADRESVHEVEQKVQAKYANELKSLLTADQYQRLMQIYWQQLGNEALSQTDVAQALDITDEQQQQIAEIKLELIDKVRNLINPPGGRPVGVPIGDELQKVVQSAKAEQDRLVLQVLTEAQQARFAELKGKPFDLDLLKSRIVK